MSAGSEPAPFTWQDGERTVRFGRGALGDYVAELDGVDFDLLGTERSLASVPELGERAEAVHPVGDGSVADLSAALVGVVGPGLIVAVGGGTVIDTAKALASVSAGTARVAAIPTTLSGAEMTSLHRQPADAVGPAVQVRPQVVVNDPALAASQPPSARAASAANALGHAVEAALTTGANPVATMAATRAIALLREGIRGNDADRLALGALLAGYSIDSAGYGMHHVLAQTLARVAGVPHSAANAAVLPHAIEALQARYPERVAELDRGSAGSVLELAHDLAARAEAERLRDFVVSREALDRCATVAEGRPQLGSMPPAAHADELEAVLAAAW